MANELNLEELAKLKDLFELLDKTPLQLNRGKAKLEAHLVAVEGENGEVGEVVELRTKDGAPVLVLCPSDYEEMRKFEVDSGQ